MNDKDKQALDAIMRGKKNGITNEIGIVVSRLENLKIEIENKLSRLNWNDKDDIKNLVNFVSEELTCVHSSNSHSSRMLWLYYAEVVEWMTAYSEKSDE